MPARTILYIAAILPARSETFVYREIFALRGCGADVRTASVHCPETELGSPELDRLAAEAIPVYGSGFLRLAFDACLESLGHPVGSLLVMVLACRDALLATDLRLVNRPKVLIQAFAALALARRVRPLGVGHIHAHMAHVPTTIAMYTARALGIGFSFTGHANDLFPNRALLGEKIGRSTFVSCISRWHRDFYRGIVSKDAYRLPVIRCGVDTAAEAFAPAVHGESLRILGAGRLVAKKGFDVLIEAVRIVVERSHVRIELTIAGSGPEEADLRALAGRLEPAVSVFMPGSLDNRRVMELMAACELFVLPLRVTAEGDRDGIPVVLMEAMAYGRCVVSGDLPTIRELVENGNSGYLIPVGDARTLADIIERLALNRTLLDALGQQARRRIVEEFDVNANARALLKTMVEAGFGR
jgi:glycosyltransferase involved in cell wall biosynthesis